MRPRPMIRCRLVLTGMLLVSGCAINLAASSARAEPEDRKTDSRKVVARVNGRPIYETQLKPELERSLRKFRRYGMRKDDVALVKRLQRKILDRMIGEQLIYRESQKLTIDNVDQRVGQELKALQMKYGVGERFEKYLTSKKLAMKDLEETLRAKVYVAEYLKRQGVLEPAIPESRIRETYENHPENYVKTERVKVSHILIAVNGHAGPEEKQQARQKAESIRQEILAGKDFAELAKKYSECNTASGGGSLGYIKKNYMPTEFDQAAFAMEKNAVSEVVETVFGFHIIKVFDKKSAGVASYEEVREFVKKFLQQKESEKKLAALIAELKGKAKIEFFLKES